MTAPTINGKPIARWVRVCRVDDIAPHTGVAALIGKRQIAVFRPDASQTIYALSNYDPFSKAFVLSRGIIGDKDGIVKVASPIYKQSFDLRTGACLDDPTTSVPVYPVRVSDGHIEIGDER